MKERKKNSSKYILLKVLIVIIFVSLVSAILAYNLVNKSEDELKQTTTESRLKALYQPTRNYGKGVYVIREFNSTCVQANRFDPEKINDCIISEKRMTYDINTIFEKLPPLPDDFYIYKYRLSTNKYLDLGSLDEAYWKQPEFYENTFIESGLSFYKTNNPEYWYPVGYGSYPSVQFVEAYPGATVDLYVFLYTSFGVETCQGFKLVPEYYNFINSIMEERIYQTKDPEIARKYIQIEITPDIVLLEPTYPKFEYNWTQKIRYRIKISEDAEKGEYGIGFSLAPPPKEKEAEWAKQYIKYVGLSPISPGVPIFQVLVAVK